MTTIITRLYADKAAASAVYRKLSREGFRAPDMDVIAAREGDDAQATAARLKKARVHESVAPVYADKIASGAAALVVRADYKPLGARKIALGILDASDTMVSGAEPEEYFVKSPPPKPGLPTVLSEHPLFFRIDRDPGTGRELGLMSDFIGLPMLSRRERKKSTMEYGGPVVPMETISRRPRSKSVIEGGGTVFSNALRWNTVKHR